jgi:GAF domain-containing protein
MNGMKRQNGQVKARTRSSRRLKKRGERKIGRRRSSVSMAQLTNALKESQKQQAALVEILRAVSRSKFDLQSVLESVARAAARLCRAKSAVIFRREGNVYVFWAGYSINQAYFEAENRSPIIPGVGTLVGRVAMTCEVAQIDDARTDPLYEKRAEAKVGRHRSMLGVPLTREGVMVGAIGLSRGRVDPFSVREIELVTAFANQAVIAIENARLFEAEQQRTRELAEIVEQQAAASELLRIINSSPGALEPVFATMLEQAVRICDATFGNIYRWDGSALHIVATHNTPPAFADERRRLPYHPDPQSPVGHMLAHKQLMHVRDVTMEEAYLAQRDSGAVAAVELGRARTVLSVPLVNNEELIGAFFLCRQEVRSFTDKQIELVQNFAAQAVIAIENVRLLRELQQRSADLIEALKQQRATSDLLQLISGSSGALESIFKAILENAVGICDADFGNMFLYESNAFRVVAMFNAPEPYLKARMRAPFSRPSDSGLGRLVETKEAIQIVDLTAQENYLKGDPFAVEGVELAGIRTLLAVPMLRENHIAGCIVIYRQEVRKFTEKQIELVKDFANQVVIALENRRLVKELRHRTEELERSYATVQRQASKLDDQARELMSLNQGLEQRVADQVNEIERIGRLRRFLPPQVADLIVASGAEKELESHRREITAVFCDLRGFTGFVESSDAEDVMALLRDYHAAVGAIIGKYGGTLERYAGDGVMVVFNDPVPVHNPELQAVYMALEMREAIGTLTAKWATLGHDIGFGIGIEHGFATLGTIGFEGRFDYAAIGTVSNVASRLCDEAGAGQILISPRVLMAVGDAVTVEPVGEFVLKGIRRPLAAYNVLATTNPD